MLWYLLSGKILGVVHPPKNSWPPCAIHCNTWKNPGFCMRVIFCMECLCVPNMVKWACNHSIFIHPPPTHHHSCSSQSFEPGLVGCDANEPRPPNKNFLPLSKNIFCVVDSSKSKWCHSGAKCYKSGVFTKCYYYLWENRVSNAMELCIVPIFFIVSKTSFMVRRTSRSSTVKGGKIRKKWNQNW